MTSSKTKPDFDIHWHKHGTPEIAQSKLIEARAFLRPVFEKIQNASAKLHILDVGCGDGVHAVALATGGFQFHYYYGIDFSHKALGLALKRIAPSGLSNTEFLVGDACCLPYASRSFDIVFSYGVISYTGRPDIVLNEMIRVCKPEGIIGLWLYPKLHGIGALIFSLARSICRFLGRRGSKAIVYFVIPFLPILPARSGVNLFNATWQQCAEVVAVNLLPDVLEFYNLYDVLEWFHKRKMTIQFIDPERPIAVWARV
jgi:ubiquinone/menaquinone biosynthesis C-methylase UbiE